MKYTGPKVRLCRREGFNLIGVQKKALVRKPYPPGKQGQIKRAMSNYAKQFREKQKIKRMYNLSERQFYNYYKKSTKIKGVTGELMLRMLETRLDNVIYKSGLASTIYQSRQMVNHAHFLVNGKKVNIPSYEVKKGDVITIKPKLLNSPLYSKDKLKNIKPLVRWIDFVASEGKILIVDLPKLEDFDQSININTVIEFYSR